MLACRQAFAHCPPSLFKISYVSYWSEQIANAMLYLCLFILSCLFNLHYLLLLLTIDLSKDYYPTIELITVTHWLKWEHFWSKTSIPIEAVTTAPLRGLL